MGGVRVRAAERGSMVAHSAGVKKRHLSGMIYELLEKLTVNFVDEP